MRDTGEAGGEGLVRTGFSSLSRIVTLPDNRLLAQLLPSGLIINRPLQRMGTQSGSSPALLSSACNQGNARLSGRRRAPVGTVFARVHRRSRGRASRKRAEDHAVRSVRALDAAAAPNHIPNDILGDACSPQCSVTTHRPTTRPVVADAAVSHRSTAPFTQIGMGTVRDMVALADDVYDRQMTLSDLNIFLPQGRQLCSA
jgi:hypothetical protein